MIGRPFIVVPAPPLPAAKPHRNLVRAVGSACFAYPIRVGPTTTGADAIGIETRNVGDRDSEHAVAVNVDVVRGRSGPGEIHGLPPLHVVAARTERDLPR